MSVVPDPAFVPVAPCTLRSQAVGVLYQDHHRWLVNWLGGKLSNPSDAADLAHDTFVRILQSRLGAHTIQNPRGYISTVAHGLVVDLWRRRALEQAYLEVLAVLPAEQVPSLEMQAVVKDSLMEIDRMLDGMGAKVKQVFLLSIFGEMSYPDIAKRIGVSPRTVSNYLAKAMAQCCLMVD